MEKEFNVEQEVVVVSTFNAQVGIAYLPRNLRRTWTAKNAEQRIIFKELKEALYDPGIRNMFDEGILYVHDMDIKIALGLENSGTEVPTNIIVLDDAEIHRALTVQPMHEVKEIFNKVSKDFLKEMAKYAIDNKIQNQERIELLTELTGIDIVTAVAKRIEFERIDKKAAESNKN